MKDSLKRYLNFLTVEKGLSANTIAAYRNDISKFQQYLSDSSKKKNIAPLKISQLNRNDFMAYINYLRDSGRQTPTIARNIASLRGFCLFLLSERAIKEDPLENISSPKGWKHLPHILGTEEIITLLEKPLGKKLSLRDKSILELMYSCGLRASEIINLKLQDINFEAGFITVMGKGSKERIIPINERAMESIKEYAEKLRPILLKKRTIPNLFLAKSGKPLTRQRLWQLLKIYSTGLSRVISPHTLRHCFASHLLDGGADLWALQKMLGHADISTTQIYTKVSPEKLKKVHKDYHPRG
jgi:integrase/recombinase XerD